MLSMQDMLKNSTPSNRHPVRRREMTDISEMLGQSFYRSTQTEDVEIMQFTLSEAPVDEIAEPVIRPHHISFTDHDLHNIERAYVTRKGRFTEKDIGAACGSSISYATRHQGIPEIANGFREKRQIFTMTVRIRNKTGANNISIFTGYTDRDVDFSREGMPDGDARLIFNSHNSLTELGSSDSLKTGRIIINPASEEQIINPNNTTRGGSPIYTMRPGDVFRLIDMYQTAQSYEDEGMVVDNAATRLHAPALTSRRQTATGSAYLRQIAESYITASRSGNGLEDPMLLKKATQNASTGLYVPDWSSHPFLITIDEYRRHGTNANASLYISDLRSFDKYLITPDSERYVAILNTVDHVQDHDPISGTNVEAILATKLYHNVLSKMLALGLTRVEITVDTANTRYGESPFIVAAPVSDFNVDTDELADTLEMLLEVELMSSIPAGTVVTMLMRSKSWSTIDVDIFDEPSPCHYTIPSYCDALISPVTTTDLSVIDHFTEQAQMFTNVLDLAASQRGARDRDDY